MRSSLPAAAFFALLTGALGGAAPAAAQQARTGSVLDETMVPEGRVRPQLSVIFSSWNRRFGRADDGTEGLEPLGQDLTDPTSLSLFPGVPTLQDAVRTATGLPDWDPVLGSSSGRVKQDVTTIDLGLHIGVFDWLTVGAVLPRIQPRTVVDYLFVPDTTGANLGINPAITNSTAVESFLTSAAAADANWPS